MTTINIAARPYIAPASTTEAAAAQKPAAPVTVPVNAQFVSVDGAVLPAKSPVAQQLEQALSGLSDQQKVQRLMDASHIDAAELEVLADVYVVAKANQQTNEMRTSAAETEQQRPSDRLTFDPSSWGDMSVLLAAIAALNLARTAGAELQGKFAQLAYASAVAQGRATIASGRAEMMASISGAIVSGGLAIGGAATALKGHKLRHDDAKFNQGQANQLQDKLADAQAGLMKRTPDLSRSAGTSASRAGKDIDIDTAPARVTQPDMDAASQAKVSDDKARAKRSQIDESERAVLGGDIRFTESQIKDLQLKSRLNMRAIDKLLTMSQVLMASSSVMSSMVLASVRTQAYQEQANGIERGAEMSVHKSMHDAEAQTVSEDGAEVNKLLDAMKQLMQQTNDVMSQVASARA